MWDMKWRCNRVFREHLSLSLALLYMHTEGRWFCNEIVFVCIFSTSTHFTLHFLILDLLKKFFFYHISVRKKNSRTSYNEALAEFPSYTFCTFVAPPLAQKELFMPKVPGTLHIFINLWKEKLFLLTKNSLYSILVTIYHSVF